MKILYVANPVPEEYCMDFKASMARNKLQVNLINELRNKVDVDIIFYMY